MLKWKDIIAFWIMVGRNQNICTHTSGSEFDLHREVVNTHKPDEGAVDSAFGIAVLLRGISTHDPSWGLNQQPSD